MAYKPLSQTVTNGKSAEVSSSDAVFDAVALKQDALVSGTNIKTINGASILGSGDITAASTALDNLANPTSVSQDLLFQSGKKIRLNASETVNTLLHIKNSDAVSIGVTASPIDTGATVLNTSANISSLLSVGDYIKLAGLADIARITVINSTTQITVSPSLGIGGGGSARNIEKFQTSASFRSSSNVEQFSIVDGKFKFTSNILMGEGAGDKITGATTNNIIIGNSAGRSISVVGECIFIGANAGRSFTTGISNQGLSVIIGHNAGQNYSSGGNKAVIVGHSAGSALTTANDPTLVGYNAGSTLTTGSQVTLIGGGANVTAASVNSATAIGQGATVADSSVAIGRAATANGNSSIALGASSNTNSLSNVMHATVNTAYFNTGPAGAAGGVGAFTLRLGLPTSATDIDGKATLRFQSSQSRGDYHGGDIAFDTAPKTTSGTSLTTYVEKFRIKGEGTANFNADVGINNEFPSETLTVSGNTRLESGDLIFASVGKGVKIATGTNATAGIATISNGQTFVSVSTTAVTANSIILVTNQSSSAAVCVTNKTTGSFRIEHANPVSGNQDCAWFIINPYVFDTDAQSFITTAGITDETQKFALDTLVKDLKAADLWTKLIAIYPFVGGSSTSHSYNLKNTALYQITWNGTVTHNSLGITGNGSTGYGNTGVIPSTHLSQNSCGIGVYLQSSSVVHNGGEFGAWTATTRLSVESLINDEAQAPGTSLARAFVNSLTIRRTNGLASVSRLHRINRTSSSADTAIVQTAAVDNSYGFPSTSVAAPNIALYLCAINDQGVASRFSGKTISFAYASLKYSSSQDIYLKNIIHKFQTALGRQA